MSRSLKDIRDDIDEVDQALQDLINRRASLAREVAHVKREAGESAADFYRPAREAQVLRAVEARQRGPLSAPVITHLFRELMSACLALEVPLRVGYLGPEGTYTHAALAYHFGSQVEAVACPSIEGVFRQVSAGLLDYGVAPLENSSEGLISQTLEALCSSSLQVCGETRLHIRHALVGPAELSGERGGGIEVSLAEVQRVYAHPQSLAQCRHWLDEHLPHADRVSTSSNALAAAQAAREEKSVAIASERAGSRYHLSLLATDLESDPLNVTRFIVIGRERPLPSGEDQTLVSVSCGRDRDLLMILEPLAKRQVSVSRIITRGAELLLDLRGHAADPALSEALRALAVHVQLQVLGSYPKPRVTFEA